MTSDQSTISDQVMATRPVLPRLAMIAVALACSLAGCSYAYDCEISVRVHSFPDGELLGGVLVTISSFHRTEPQLTGIDGTILLKDRVYDGDFDSWKKWTVTLSRDGYADQVIEIDAPRMPTKDRPARVVIAAHLKKM